MVEAKGKGTLVVERLDVKGERQQIELNGSQPKGKFYDFASVNRALTPGGIYSASFGTIEDRVPGRCEGQARRDADRRPPDPPRLDPAAALNARRVIRDAIAAAAIALACAGIAVSPALDRLHGLSLDILTALRFEMFGNRYNPATSPTVVVAIDEESYRAAPFKGSPTMTWTGEIGRVLNAVVEGGAKVVGFDMVIPNSIEQSEIPFGDGMLGEKRPRLRPRFPARAGERRPTPGKVVLGEQLRGNDPIRPSPGQRIAVRQQQNIRPLNTLTDADDIVRRMPLAFTVNGAKVPGMALELAARAQNATPEFGSRRIGDACGLQDP